MEARKQIAQELGLTSNDLEMLAVSDEDVEMVTGGIGRPFNEMNLERTTIVNYPDGRSVTFID